LKRGDLLPIAIPGDFGKPRPAIVLQTDRVTFTDTVLVCMITSDLTEHSPFRVNVPNNQQTGLRKPSQIMTDKTYSVLRSKCGPVFGGVNDDVLEALRTALGFIMGFSD
jgi:mRNA interferase MazF